MVASFTSWLLFAANILPWLSGVRTRENKTLYKNAKDRIERDSHNIDRKITFGYV